MKGLMLYLAIGVVITAFLFIDHYRREKELDLPGDLALMMAVVLFYPIVIPVAAFAMYRKKRDTEKLFRYE